jgi:hypothetical protein
MDHGERAVESPVMTNRILRILLIILALFSVLAVHETVSIGVPGVHPLYLITILAVTALVFLCLVLRSARAKRGVLFVFYLLATIEIIFQALALASLLPRVDIHNHVPFGRVYWTREGHANSTMNRYGWYYPAFNLESGSPRIVLIGDSMIQGVQVRRAENAGVVLEHLLHAGTRPEAAVLACAHSGTGPAHYLELLRYAAEYLDPDEVIICVFIGNDFVNVLRRGDAPVDPHDQQIYYYIDDDGRLRMHDGSEAARCALHRRLAYNHRSLPLQAYRIARGHCFTRAVLRRLIKSITARGSGTIPEEASEIGEDLRALGLDDVIFRKKPDAVGLETLETVKGILKRCDYFAESRGITLRIVTIPVFPSFFFTGDRAGNWSLETAEYDFLLPERALADFASENGIPMLPLGASMHETGTTVERIEGLYFHGGRGHFTPAGHRFLAQAICNAFYGAP